MMYEENYVELAESRATTDVMTRHWQQVLEDRVWVSLDNKETPFKQLDSRHIYNIINGLLDFKHPLCKDIIRELTEELYNRCASKEAQEICKKKDK